MIDNQQIQPNTMKQIKTIITYISSLKKYTFIYKIQNTTSQPMQYNFTDTYQTSNYQQQDSGFKAWQANPIPTQNNNTNLLRNFKSQLLTYQQNYKKHNNQTLPIKLPSLENLKPKKTSQTKITKKTSHTLKSNCALTQRKPTNASQDQNLIQKHKSIQISKKPQNQKHTHLNPSSRRLKSRHENITTIQNNLQHQNEPIVMITKVQQMKFLQNQKRIRKRDLYLAIFGQKGKGKVQKIQFDDENKAYQVYLERKNQQAKGNTSTVVNNNMLSQQDKCKIRSSSQLNHRCVTKKPEQTIGQSVNFIVKNNSHAPMRY